MIFGQKATYPGLRAANSLWLYSAGRSGLDRRSLVSVVQARHGSIAGYTKHSCRIAGYTGHAG